MGVLNLNGILSLDTVAATTERNIATMSEEAVRADIRVKTGLATSTDASNRQGRGSIRVRPAARLLNTIDRAMNTDALNRQVRGSIGVRPAARLLNTIDLATSTAALRQTAVHVATKMANLGAASIPAKDRKGISVQMSGFKKM